jgi:DNA-directed RNA polymerase subunit delta
MGRHTKGGSLMDHVQRKLQYVKGLADGLGMDQSREGRVFQNLIEVIDELVAEVRTLKTSYEELDEYVEAIDEDLTDLETDLYELDDLDEDELEYDETDNVMDYDDDDIGYFEVECPNCQELVALDQDIFENEDVVEVLCPECQEVILINDDELLEDVEFADEEVDEFTERRYEAFPMEEDIDEPRIYT